MSSVDTAAHSKILKCKRYLNMRICKKNPKRKVESYFKKSNNETLKSFCMGIIKMQPKSLYISPAVSYISVTSVVSFVDVSQQGVDRF